MNPELKKTNRYFEHLYQTSEQDIWLDLVQESIQIHGTDVVYIVREIENMDELLREEKLSVFRKTFIVDSYVEGQGNGGSMQKYMSKFGFRFEDNKEIYISTKSWAELENGMVQPREGDYIYIGNPENPYASFVNCMYQINQVWDGHSDSFQFGSIPSYRLVLSSVNKSHSNVFDTEYTDINDFLNPPDENDDVPTAKPFADDFLDINIVENSNDFHRWGMGMNKSKRNSTID